MIAFQILFALFLVSFVLFYVEVFRSIKELKRQHAEFWTSLGPPDLFSPNGQIKYLRLAFGKPEVPQASSGLKQKLFRVKLFLVGGVIFFVALMPYAIMLSKK